MFLKLVFTEVDVSDAVEYLAKQSRDVDPEGNGVNFVLKIKPTFLGTEAETAEQQTGGVIDKLTLQLKNTPLIEVLDTIMILTNLQYKIEEYAVFIFPNNETNEIMSVRSFSVPPNFFQVDLATTDVTAGLTTTKTVEAASVDVKQQLVDNGVQFSAGAKATYLPKAAKLIVRNTLGQLNLIDQLLAQSAPSNRQIEVETKFVQFEEDKIKDLSFNYQVMLNGIPNPADLFFSDDAGVNNSTDPNIAILNPTGATAPNFAINRPQTSVQQTTTDANGNITTSRVNFGQADAAATTAGLRSTAGLSDDGIDNLLGLTLANRSSNTFSFSGIIADSGFRALISAIETTLGGDLMAAPRATMISGERVQIDIAREMLYPTDFQPPEPVQGGNNFRAAVSRVPEPGGPLSFTSRSIGVVLDVRATANNDRTIDLELQPNVTDFDGFINYGGSVSTADFNNPTTPLVIFEGVALQPVFSVRSLETQVKVVDGQTVVMGGFIRDDTEEIEDRVPFFGDLPLLGRFFRSETMRSIKKNMMIFVTARLLNPDGTPEFLTESEEEFFGAN